MPRIRKETSNRAKTKDRKRLQQRVRDSKKKKAKLAKKNPQWKSRVKKDPGIPNNFPFKDQLLAELAEQRRIAAEEKQRKRESKKPKASTPTLDDENEVRLNDGEAVASITAKTLQATVKPKPPQAAPAEEDEETEDEEPMLIDRELPTLKSVLDIADVVLHVLDARDPLAFRSQFLENAIKQKGGQKTMFVLNKIDICPREAISGWLSHLRKEHPTFLFRSASSLLPQIIEPKGKGKGKLIAEDGWGIDSILKQVREWSTQKKGGSDKPFTVAVVGIANVGKSSLINTLLHKASLPVYMLSSASPGATTTQYPQQVIIDDIRFIDTPGWLWSSSEETSLRARDILYRNRGRIDRLKDPVSPIEEIVKRCSQEDLMLLYSLPAFQKGDTESFLAGVARMSQLVKKRGVLDLPGAARVVLRDWNVGKLRWYAAPPKGEEIDDPLLEQLSTRKELRKADSIIKLEPSLIDAREVELEENWINELTSKSDTDEDNPSDDDDGDENEAHSDASEDGDEDEDHSDASKDEEEEDESKDDEEEEELPPLQKHKRKAKAMPAAGPPPKKVTFAPPPKNSKQARAEGSKKGAAKAKLSAAGDVEYDFTKFF